MVFEAETEDTEGKEEAPGWRGGTECELTSSSEQAAGCRQRRISTGVGLDLSNRVGKTEVRTRAMDTQESGPTCSKVLKYLLKI